MAGGRQGIVLNVFTEQAWRRRGLATLLLEHVIAWAGPAGLDTLVLHASADGRRLYERLGFLATAGSDQRPRADDFSARQPA